MITLTLPRDLEAWAEREVAEGAAPSVEELVRGALDARRAELARLRADLGQARASLDVGRGLDGDAFLDELATWSREDAEASSRP